MKELRKKVFAAQNSYVQAFVESFKEMRKEIERTGEVDTNIVQEAMQLKQAEINERLNLAFDEAEERLMDSGRKHRFFGR